MTGKQQSILWLGIILIILRGVTAGQFAALWGIIGTKGATTTTGGTTPVTPSTPLATGASAGDVPYVPTYQSPSIYTQKAVLWDRISASYCHCSLSALLSC